MHFVTFLLLIVEHLQ